MVIFELKKTGRWRGGESTMPFPFRRLVVVVFLNILWFGAPVAARGETPLRVGAAAVNLEADDSMVVAGGIGPAYVKGQEGELRAVAVVIEKEPWGKVAMVGCDVLFVPGDLCDAALRTIKKETGIAADRVLINASHTHHAPSVAPVHGYGEDQLFRRRLREGIVEAVIAANAQLDGPVHMLFGEGEEKTIGGNSRFLLGDGSIYWIGPRKDQVRATGPFDPELPVLAFRDSGARLRALIYNHSTHPIGTRRAGVRSSSFYGLAAQELENELGGVVSFLEGASGSTHNVTGVSTAEAVNRLKQAVRVTLEEAKPHPVNVLASIKRPFKFKVRQFDEASEDEKVVRYCRKRAPKSADYYIGVFRKMRAQLKPHQGDERETSIQAMRIGEVAIVGVPAEYFTSLGVDIKKRSPFAATYVAELSNDWIGYLPDREGHRLGGYQTWMGLHSYAEVGTGERMADEVLKMLDELHRQGE